MKPLNPTEQRTVEAIKKAIERAGSMADAYAVEFFFSDIDIAHDNWDTQTHDY